MAEADHILADAQLRASMGMAVRVLAQQRAIREVKQQFRAQGLKTSNMTHREIVTAAEEYLAEHRARLIEEMKPIVQRWRAEGASSESGLRRVFGKSQNYEHCPNAKIANAGKFNDERRSANPSKPNTTAPVA